MSPRVSIVIPTFNRARYLRESIDSALAQTFQDLEIIVVDDGSTDGTREVVASYGDRVRYIRQENLGPPAAMNTGVRNSRGEYYMVLGDDDALLPDMLEHQVRALDGNPDAAFVCSGVHFMDANGEIYKTSRAGRERDRTFKSLLFDNFVWHLTTLVRRSVSEELGHFDESLQTTHDHDLWVRMAIDHPFEYTDKPLARFRRHPGNFSKTLGLHLQDHFAILNKPEVRAQLTVWEWLRLRGVNYYRFAMFYARTGDLLRAAGCYAMSVVNCPWVGASFWTAETEKMRFSLPYRVAKPFLMPFYYLLKDVWLKTAALLGLRKEQDRTAADIRKDNLA